MDWDSIPVEIYAAKIVLGRPRILTAYTIFKMEEHEMYPTFAGKKMDQLLEGLLQLLIRMVSTERLIKQ
jgi:hypothetical protein